jgi:hypothetical protein
MRFMVLVKADPNSESGALPDEKLIVEMGKFNEELVKAGALLAADGLQPSSKGVRILLAADGKRTIVDGPFTESKELIAGFWMVEMKSMAEAVEWFSRCPISVEIRPVFASEDFEEAIKTDEGRAVMEAEKEFRKRQSL